MPVMIVDDAETNLLVIKSLVEACGVPGSTTFKSPTEAIDRLDDLAPTLILVDYMMPDLDGIAFIRLVRSRPRFADTPVVMVTTADQRSVRLEALEAGATDFILKPIDPAEFKARFRNLMQLADAQAKLKDQAAWLSSEVHKAMEVARGREAEIVTRLARAAELRDPETGQHLERMSRYSEKIARALALDDEFCERLRIAAPMHDIGKIGIPDSILLKPGPLTPAERLEMQKHAQQGGEILERSTSELIRLAGEIAISHHERFDGSGYPFGLAGEAIPLSGRITSLADVFDALTSVRPYKKAWAPEEARSYILAERGRHFDPACVDAMMAAWNEILAIHASSADPDGKGRS
jgi:response regulator RpfG family c-di-GMP phosphodiesterase